MNPDAPGLSVSSAAFSRRAFLQSTAAVGAALLAGRAGAQNAAAPAIPTRVAGDDGTARRARPEDDLQTGAQRLSVAALKKWEAMKFGMFIHFGMSTFAGAEAPKWSTPTASPVAPT